MNEMDSEGPKWKCH